MKSLRILTLLAGCTFAALALQTGNAAPKNTSALTSPALTQCRGLLAPKAVAGKTLTLKSLKAKIRNLNKAGTFHIPLHGGFVAAANVGNHGGNYGRYFWFRDMARVFKGLEALPALLTGAEKVKARAEAREMALSMLKALEDPEFRSKALMNIENPSLHMDPEKGFNAVIWIRRLLDPFVDGRSSSPEELQEESIWGHKQNDALAVLGHVLLDALNDGVLSPSDFSEQARLNLMLLPAYFVRVNYFAMWDVGAWEEKQALRTSSVGLATSFLERFHRSYNSMTPPGAKTEDRFLHIIKEKSEDLMASQLSEQSREVVRQALSSRSIYEAIEEGTQVIKKGLGLIRAPGEPRTRIFEAQEGDEVRHEDMALLHLLWYPPQVLSLRDKLHLVESLKMLERPMGYIRYEDDLFLRSPEGEAQWTLFDSDLTSFYSELYLESKESEYLDKAKYHAARMLSQITTKDTIDLEDSLVPAGRIPEAYTPVRINGKIEYRASPNSPLNWSTANAIRALRILTQAMEAAQ